MRTILALVISIAAFQSPATAASDRGAIHGRVLQSGSDEPVKKATVILRRGQEPGSGAATDASGAFRFDDLEPGAWTISAERTGFVLDPDSERTIVNVKAGPAESEVTLKMVRTGAISGRVLDSDGEPVTGAAVQVAPVNSKKAGVPAFSAATDDRGEYRAYNIPPGKYHIAVSYEPSFQQRQVRMQRPAETSALTYYPAALDPKQAQTINVEGGADLRGYDVRMLSARGVTVRGVVSAVGGAPAGAIVFVTLSPIRRTVGFRTYENVVQNPSGAFELTPVLAGTYALAATAPLGEQKLSAHQVIDVGNADIEGMQLTLAPPQTVSGAIILPEGRKMPAGLVAVLVPRENRYDGAGGLSQPGNDGEFQIRNVAQGDYDVALANTGAGDDLYVSAIQVGDDDALGGGVHVGPQSVGRLKIVLKGNGGTVQLSVKDSKGKPLPDSHVRLVPDAPRRAQMALYGECKTDASGACGMLGVAPGSYHAFAFAEESRIDFRDSAATADIEDSGKAITIAEGASQNVELMPVPDDK
jgi:hypothetical protein